jgi:hypothetical protein
MVGAGGVQNVPGVRARPPVAPPHQAGAHPHRL